ncbi:MAG: SDR family oxidoreductase, partial [Candidatus Sericytochromatia bacterium]|nr:SDR family oxidoreductase [Candidatus Sericytochromatia bacterium]
MSSKTLITGASGYLGQLVAHQLVKEAGAPVVMWVHADNETQAAAKIARLKEAYLGFEHLMEWTWGALEAETPFAGVAPIGIARIIHTAAIYRFDIDEETARRVNVEGTRKVLDLAERCPGLRHVCLVSSLYASGLMAGDIPEERFPFGPQAPFTNHYERSKHLSEEVLFERPQLPWSIARVGLVVADDESGHVTQFNALHYTLKLFHHGLMSVFPGDPETRLYFVTGGFAARAIADICRLDAPRCIYHVAHAEAHGVPLAEAIDLAFTAFLEDPRFRARRLPRPLFIDQAGFDVLVAGMAGLGNRAQVQAISGVASFARQLYIRKEARNEHLLAALSHYAPEDQR